MYKRILLPLDGSALAEQALPYAVVQAERFQAELILLKVFEPLARSLNLPPWAVREAEETTRKLAREYFERVVAGVRESGISVWVVMVEGHPHEEITRFTEAKQVDLIVICTRGYSGISCWFKGGVAARVARDVSVPVLLVRARKE